MNAGKPGCLSNRILSFVRSKSLQNSCSLVPEPLVLFIVSLDIAEIRSTSLIISIPVVPEGLEL